MNTKTLRMKSSKRGVTPVIATIILIAGTLVLALVVGAYTFGLFGSNVKTITLTSGNLFAGSLGTITTTLACPTTGQSYITMSLNNPGAKTNITSFTLTGSSLTGTVNPYFSTTSTTCPLISGSAPVTEPVLVGGSVSPVALYFSSSTSGALVTSGQTYNYVINFGNGQSVSGSLIAQ